MTAQPHAPTRYRPATRDTLYVSEVFSSLQGEGPHMGQPATFLRLMGCNLACSWCDTAYTWDHRTNDLKAGTWKASVADVYTRLQTHHPTRLVITGGEPLLQHAALGPLLNRIGSDQPWRVEVESNGTRPPPATWLFQVEQWNISPKLAHSGNPPAKALDLSLLRVWAQLRTAHFKFVCKTAQDVAQVATLADSLGISPANVWIMPEGTTTPTQIHRLRRLTPYALAHGFNLSPRLHVLIWGNQRGR